MSTTPDSTSPASSPAQTLAPMPAPFDDSPCHRHRMRVPFGDCDPAQIVYFVNFYRYFDNATHALTEAAGYELVHVRSVLGWVGFPVADASARFFRPATINDALVIETRVQSWQPKRFVLAHRIVRDGVLLATGEQTRFIGIHRQDRGGRLATLAIPDDFRAAIDTCMTPA